MSATLYVYDPAMCCSTGVCGPSVDPKLLRLASDISFLKGQGITVERFNLGRQPQAFTRSPMVMAAMGPRAENLPLFIVNNSVRAKGCYPSRAEMASWFGLDAAALEEKPRKQLNVLPSDGCCSDVD